MGADACRGDPAAGRRHSRAAEIHGPVTNRDLLVRVLEHPESAAGRTDTAFLDAQPGGAGAAAGDDAHRELHALAAALAAVAADPRALAAPGRRPVAVAQRRPRGADVPLRRRWRRASRRSTLPVDADVVVAASPRPVDVELDASTGCVTVVRLQLGSTTGRYVDSALGSTRRSTCCRASRCPSATRIPGSLLAPMPGSVVQVTAVAEDDSVEAGDVVRRARGDEDGAHAARAARRDRARGARRGRRPGGDRRGARGRSRPTRTVAADEPTWSRYEVRSRRRVGHHRPARGPQRAERGRARRAARRHAAGSTTTTAPACSCSPAPATRRSARAAT